MKRSILVATSCLLLATSSLADARTALTGPTTFYIDALPSYSCPGANCAYGIGSDTNDGLTPQTPWATFEHMKQVLASQIDAGGQFITIVLMSAPASTCSQSGGCATKFYFQHLVIPPVVGQIPGRTLNNCTSPNFIIGTGTPAVSVISSDPANHVGAFIQPPAVPAGQPTQAAISIMKGADAYISGFGVESSVTNADIIDAFGDLVIGQLLFGGAGQNVQIAQGPHAWTLINGPLYINGGGTSFAQIGPQARMDFNTNGLPQCPVSVTFNYPINYPSGFVNMDDGGTAFFPGISFTNKNLVTGPQAVLAGSGDLVLKATGVPPDPNYLPGSSGIQFTPNFLPTGAGGTYQQAPTAVTIR